MQALPGIAMDAGLVEDPRAWIRAVSLWNPNAVVAGAAAAAITFDEETPLTTVPVYVKDRVADRGPLRFIAGDLDPELLQYEGGIRVTNPAATAVTAGLAGQFGPGTAALRKHRTSPGKIAEAAEAFPLRSRPRARGVALDLSGNPWSPAEVDCHRLFRKAGITGWVGNVEVWLSGARYVPDVSLRGARIAFEVDSFQHHGSREAMEQDSGRRNQFLSHGWRSYTLLPSQIRDLEEETIAFVRSVVWRNHLSSA